MRALITGASGQDGSYLSELLLDKGYEVFACVRHSSVVTTPRISHLVQHKNFHLVNIDLGDTLSVLEAIKTVDPNEVYNLGAQSHVKVSYSVPEYTGNTNALGSLRLLESLRTLKVGDRVKFYQASTSELFGNSILGTQNETTPFAPRSPYGISKLYAYWIAVHHRNAYDMFAVNGILFNHESPRRPQNFVTRKISVGVSRITKGEADVIHLGNLDAYRDWGHAADYVKGIFAMMQHSQPDDFVLATGESRSVREFVEKAFSFVGVQIVWQGRGVDEIGIDGKTGKTRILVDSKFYRPGKEIQLRGDASKARSKLNWRPETTFEQLVEEMVSADLNGSNQFQNY
jgi:GDPmannose 4,6-dehydratase